MRAIEAVTAKGETSALCQSIDVSRASLYRRRLSMATENCTLLATENCTRRGESCRAERTFSR